MLETIAASALLLGTLQYTEPKYGLVGLGFHLELFGKDLVSEGLLSALAVGFQGHSACWVVGNGLLFHTQQLSTRLQYTSQLARVIEIKGP